MNKDCAPCALVAHYAAKQQINNKIKQLRISSFDRRWLTIARNKKIKQQATQYSRLDLENIQVYSRRLIAGIQKETMADELDNLID